MRFRCKIGQTSSIDFASEADYSSRTFDTSGETISEGDVLSDGSTVVTTGAAGVSSTVNQTSNQYGASSGSGY